jgi:hypothetical protein
LKASYKVPSGAASFERCNLRKSSLKESLMRLQTNRSKPKYNRPKFLEEALFLVLSCILRYAGVDADGHHYQLLSFKSQRGNPKVSLEQGKTLCLAFKAIISAIYDCNAK